MKLSDKEIKAVEKVKEVIRIDKERRIVTLYDEKPLFRDQLQIIIDLINKQQKEIEELKEKNTQLTNYLNDSYYVSADKIKEKIKEQRQKYFDIHGSGRTINEIVYISTEVDGAIKALNELLKEK